MVLHFSKFVSFDKQSPISKLLRIARLLIIAQLFGRIVQLGLRNLACATRSVVQLSWRNYAGTNAQQLCNCTSSTQFQHPSNLQMTRAVHNSKTLFKFPSPWNFTLTWSVDKVTWNVHNVKIISKFPLAWSFKLRTFRILVLECFRTSTQNFTPSEFHNPSVTLLRV